MKKIPWLFFLPLLVGCTSANVFPTSNSPMSGESSKPDAISPSKATEKEESTVPSSEEPMENTTITFGNYQGEKITWYVLEEKDGISFLFSVGILDSRPFNETPATWDESSIRSFLNGEFMNSAFTEEERENILLTSLDNGDDLGYKSKVGKNTEDKVFLLSANESKEYLTQEMKVSSPTGYALKEGAYANSQGYAAWWLRSPGMNDASPAYYSSQGEIGTRSHLGSETIIGTRPAIRVNSSAIHK